MPIKKIDKVKNRLLTKIVFIAVVFGSCDSVSDKHKNMGEQNKHSDKKLSQQDTTPKVTGIGGIFFFSDNPDKAKEWYSKNLGLEVNQWGASFEFRNANRPDEINYLQCCEVVVSLLQKIKNSF